MEEEQARWSQDPPNLSEDCSGHCVREHVQRHVGHHSIEAAIEKGKFPGGVYRPELNDVSVSPLCLCQRLLRDVGGDHVESLAREPRGIMAGPTAEFKHVSRAG